MSVFNIENRYQPILVACCGQTQQKLVNIVNIYYIVTRQLLTVSSSQQQIHSYPQWYREMRLQISGSGWKVSIRKDRKSYQRRDER